MPIYVYKVKLKPDVFRTGTIEADNEKAAINKLLLLNYHPVSIKPKAEASTSRFSFKKKITQKDIYVFLRQLANLNLAGLSLVKSLGNISAQCSNEKLKIILIDVKEKIQKGRTFSESLSSYSDIFSSLEINMIKSSETTGTLPEVIAKIADLKERDITFNNRIRSALAYPVLLISVGIITLFVLITFVLPKFVTLFEDLEQQLPLLTQLLISVSLFFKNYWGIIVFLAMLLVLFLRKYLHTKQGKTALDTFELQVFFLRDIVIKIQTARFARTLGSLIENGVSIINALQIVAQIATNLVFNKEIMHVHSLVVKGQHLSEALKNSAVFDRNTKDLIAAGEESGRLDEMLFRIAEMNENESNQQIEVLMFMLEPVLILSLGIIVGIIVMAILLPIFQMNFLIQ